MAASVGHATTNLSNTAPYSDTDRAARIALIPLSFVVLFLVIWVMSRCTRKGPPAENIVESRGDLVPVPQERVIRIDHCDLKRLEITEHYRRQFTGGFFLSSSATNDVDKDVGVQLHEDRYK
jgi:hypothetical protein